MLERVFHPDAERGEENGTTETLLVHDPQPKLSVLVLGAQGLEFAEGILDLLPTRIASIPVVERARFGHGIEGRIGHVGVDGPTHQEPAAAVDLGPADAPSPQPGVLVPGEGIDRFVVVVVEVEDPVGVRRATLCHPSPPRGPSPPLASGSTDLTEYRI